MSDLNPNDGIINGNESDLKSGGDGLGWRAQLPDDLKTNEAFTVYKTIGELAKSHLDTAGKVKEFEGKLANSIPKLTENSTEEEKAAYYKAIGRPEKADGYEIKVPDGLPTDEGTVSWFKETAFKLGMPKTQTEQFANAYFEKMREGMATIDKQIEQRQKETTNKLKSEWGGKYQENFDLAKKTAQNIGGEEIIKFLDDTGFGNDPTIIKFMHKLGTLIAESVFIREQGNKPNEPERTEGGMPLLKFPSMENQGG